MTATLQEVSRERPGIHVDVVEPGTVTRPGTLPCVIDEHLRFNTAKMESYFFAQWEPVLYDAFLLAAAVDWSSDLGDPTVGFIALVAVFGALGACLSAIQSLGHAGAQGPIPEHVATSLITITRPALGAAAALGAYAIAASGLLNISLEGEEAHLTVLALAFAAGFSERLVLSAVGAATGSTQEK